MCYVFISGCYCQYEKRYKEWLEPKHDLLFKLDDILITKEQCIHSIGNPDYIISPDEFISRLDFDDHIQETIIPRLVKGYLRAKGDKVNQNRLYSFYEDYEFHTNCSLWLYDESKHYKKAVKPPMFTMCAYSGFSCFCYYVEDNNVIGGTVFHFWKPLNDIESIPE